MSHSTTGGPRGTQAVLDKATTEPAQPNVLTPGGEHAPPFALGNGLQAVYIDDCIQLIPPANGLTEPLDVPMKTWRAYFREIGYQLVPLTTAGAQGGTTGIAATNGGGTTGTKDAAGGNLSGGAP